MNSGQGTKPGTHIRGGSRTPLGSRFGRARRVQTALRLIPFAVWHVLRRPYRTSAEARRVGTRLSDPESRRMTHDIYCAMLLRGYRRVTGYRVSAGTGLAAVLFAVFIYTFDQQFERQRRSGSLAGYEAVLESAPVAAVWAAMAGYLRAHRRDTVILDHLHATFRAHYSAYRQLVTRVVARPDYTEAVRLAEYDSGLALRTMYDVIRLFNGHPYHEECARQFFAVGMAGKYVDDLGDVADDHASGNPNLLSALVRQQEADGTAVEAALQTGGQLALWWWTANCPVSFGAYMRDAFRYYDGILDQKLRLPVDVYLLILHSSRFWRTERRRSPLSQQ